ncbi:hypothetical protein QJS10_CPB20g01576 [Acorus calamus]|uniref:ARM repeat superfamily protein n=1 Tax=Acorus calamus TaxID=4465 RepID=A0AAV9C944_ACOCL|nr:hypothetical protein QJS10_CPB20g01576 [Acorus calamus]
MQTQTKVLEEWLRHATSPTPPPPPPPPSAQSIIKAWGDLRRTHHEDLLRPLQTLFNARHSLHISEPQAKLLLSLLSSTTSPPSHHPLLFRLLSLYIRKSLHPSLPIIDSSLSYLLSHPIPPLHLAESVLLLGSISAVPSLSDASRSACFGLLSTLLEEQARSAGASCPTTLPEVLAGVGYALFGSDGAYFSRILASVLQFWGFGDGFPPSVAHGVMVLRLAEWLVSNFRYSKSFGKIGSLCEGISAGLGEVRCMFAVGMAACGVLRVLNWTAVPNGGLRIDPWIRSSMEDSIAAVAGYAISDDTGSGPHHRLLQQCLSLGLARCGAISFRAPVLLCIFSALSNEIFPLSMFSRRVIENPNGNSEALGVSEVRAHLGNSLFKEAGAIARIFCNQYALADEQNKLHVEDRMWDYCHEIYSNLRFVSLILPERSSGLLEDLERIAEAAFLMVVVFAAEVTKHKWSPVISQEVQSETAARILTSFSCVEYLRRVRLPEYTDVIQRVVRTIQDSCSACLSYIESMPSYLELTNQQGMVEKKYVWFKDEVQTARVLFYFRVIPTCISHIPGSVFAKIVAPVMFLYMQHPIAKVARASHSVLVAFMSYGKDDNNQDDVALLKEKLVFYYMERALETYPGITPFDGLASGVVALIRHLPAGSPAIFYCIHSLATKASNLLIKNANQDANLWKNWQGESEPCQKILELLLRLVYLVDIQVLPDLLRLLAQFIAQLPKDGQNLVLDEIHSQVAESDDVTRKPLLVSWLQSLTYNCSKISLNGSSNESTLKQDDGSHNASSINNYLSLNRTSSRL